MKVRTNEVQLGRRWLLVALVSIITVGLLALSHAFGPNSVGFAFAAVWLPMMWLGTASRVVVLRLPGGLHELRAFERDGRVYELLGVRVIKFLLRRGPLSAFNPDLHLPKDRSPERLALLDGRMREAEAGHAILFMLSLGLTIVAAVLAFWTATGWILGFNVLVNGYPVMLQRYNRGRLAQRFGPF